MVGQLGIVGIEGVHVDFEADLERGGVVLVDAGGAGDFLETAVVLAARLGAGELDGGVLVVEGVIGGEGENGGQQDGDSGHGNDTSQHSSLQGIKDSRRGKSAASAIL